MLNIAPWNEDSLVALQTFGLARMIEAFDLFIYSSYCLNFSLLVYRSGNRKVLLDRKVGQSREYRVELCAGRTVTVYSAIALFEDESTRDAQRFVSSVLVLQISRYYQDPFRVYLSAELGLAFDVDHSFSSETNAHGYPGRLAEVEVA